MPDDTVFADFIRRIRAGDAEAAAELVRRYESVIRVEVRHRLSDPRLRRLFDSLDISQSVLASFFVRAASGQYGATGPAREAARGHDAQQVGRLRRHRCGSRRAHRSSAGRGRSLWHRDLARSYED